MDAFSNNQGRMREYMQSAVGQTMNPFAQWEEIGRQNMAMFERTFQMFTPFGGANGEAPQNGDAEVSAAGDDETRLDELKTQIENLRRQLDDLAR